MKELKKKQRGEMAAAMNRRPDHPDNGTENLAKLVCFSLYKSLPGSGFQRVAMMMIMIIGPLLLIRRRNWYQFFYSRRKWNGNLNDPRVHNNSIHRPVSHDCRFFCLPVSQVLLRLQDRGEELQLSFALSLWLSTDNPSHNSPLVLNPERGWKI